MEAYAGVKNDRYRLWIVSHVMGQSAVRLNPPLLSHDVWVGKGVRTTSRPVGRVGGCWCLE